MLDDWIRDPVTMICSSSSRAIALHESAKTKHEEIGKENVCRMAVLSGEALIKPRAYANRWHRKVPRRVNRCTNKVGANYQWKEYPKARCRQTMDKRAACPCA